MENMRALFGLHGSEGRNYAHFISALNGWSYEYVVRFDEMVERASMNSHGIYIMDSNLGDPGSPDVSPAREIYSLVRRRVESGKAKFIAMSDVWNCGEIPMVEFRLIGKREFNRLYTQGQENLL